MKENRELEYKETVNNNFLKTVSAFANYGTGKILFGIRDDGTVAGISEPYKACLDIENKINDSISPKPNFTLNVNKKTDVITLEVQEGIYKPYLYKSKAYKRNDTSTIEVERLELTRLILEGQGTDFEELPAITKDLKFVTLEKKLKSAMNIKALTPDILKTLELCKDADSINIAGELLADTNSFYGIDIVRFGDSISILLDREIYEHESVLLQYDSAVNVFKKYYQYEEIKEIERKTISTIPEEAFREAVANAIVHRTWDIPSHINIGMYADHIEIISPGGIPEGLTKEEYMRGGVSILRNPILGNVFYRLKLIERFGTGIRRINEAYQNSKIKPTFVISDNFIRVILPVINPDNGLSEDENIIYELIKGKSVQSGRIAELSGFGKTKVVRILNKLVKYGYIRTIGNGRGKKYFTD